MIFWKIGMNSVFYFRISHFFPDSNAIFPQNYRMFLKKSYIFAIFGLFFACDSDDYQHAEIASVVLNSFKTEFPKAREVEWTEKHQVYKVEFKWHNDDYKVLLNHSGDILKVKKEIEFSEFPAEIKERIQQNFSGEDIDDPEIITENDKQYYQFEIDRLFFDKKIILDQSGKIVTEKEYWN